MQYYQVYNKNKNTFILFRILLRHKNPKKEIYKLSSIATLRSENTIDDEYYPESYMEEYKYERMEEISHFDSDSDSDSDYE